MIDSHCHIDLEEFDDDRDFAIAHALGDGVRAILNVGFNRERARATDDLVARYDFFYGVVGLHPHDADDYDEVLVESFDRMLDHPRILGVGEVGLDFHHDRAPREVQERVFRRMIQLAHHKSAPLVIHCREAFDDALRILEEEGPPYRGIFHAFGGTLEQASRAIELGFHLGIGGVVTYRNSGLAEVVSQVPLDRIVLETDSPYLTPQPWRGRRNEPAYVLQVLRRVAAAHDVSPAEVSAATDEAFCRAMGLAPDLLPGPVFRVGARAWIHVDGVDDDEVEAALERLGGAPERAADAGDAVDEAAAEVILCGLTDPLAHPQRVRALAEGARERGWRVRVDTDAGARDAEAPAALAGVVDELVVRFYGVTPEQHDRVAWPPGGVEGFDALCETVRTAVREGIDTVCEFIAAPRFRADPCRELARKLGAKYDIRMYRS